MPYDADQSQLPAAHRLAGVRMPIDSLADASGERNSILTAWVARAHRELETADFAQVDIDELFDPPPEMGAQAALDCLKLIVALARETDPDLDGLLALPLPYIGLELVTDAPSLGEILDQPWSYGRGRMVPGLYVVRPDIWRAYDAGEEYRKSVEPDTRLEPGYVAYYRCWRSSLEVEHGWEYNRVLFVRTV